jgi:hypothetical protein
MNHDVYPKNALSSILSSMATQPSVEETENRLKTIQSEMVKIFTIMQSTPPLFTSEKDKSFTDMQQTTIPNSSPKLVVSSSQDTPIFGTTHSSLLNSDHAEGNGTALHERDKSIMNIYSDFVSMITNMDRLTKNSLLQPEIEEIRRLKPIVDVEIFKHNDTLVSFGDPRVRQYLLFLRHENVSVSEEKPAYSILGFRTLLKGLETYYSNLDIVSFERTKVTS